MNYAGKFDATISSDGQGAASPFNVHVESGHGHVPADAIVVPDAHFLFNADFKRSGLDLVLSGRDHELVLHDYFKGEKRASLASPDGAHLTGDIVTALTGAVDVSQAGAPAASGQVIGHVTKLVGSATVIRNGVSIILNMGDNVEKGDVAQCGSNSTLGLTFIDGTVFGLSSNARMVLNEMVYDPNGSNNSSLLSLVAGTITFVAGETARHGDMKVDTPVATMGIRGTAVLVEIDFSVPGQNTTPDAHFQVLVEPDGHTGSYILFDKTTLQPIAQVNQAGQQINITNGVITQSNEPLPPDIQKLIQDVFTQKFSANDTHTKTAQTDTLNPLLFTGSAITAANAIVAVPQFALTGTSQSSNSSNLNQSLFLFHLDIPPTVVVNGGSLRARAGAQVDTASGTIAFADVNAADRPTATARFSSFTVLDANHNDITSTLTAQQLAAIQAVETQLSLSPSAANTNIGTVAWTYSVADAAFSFLPTGDTLNLTYMVQVDTNYPPSNLTTLKPLTITITASNQVSWIHPTGGLWSVGSNWDAGQAPTANDDVIIPAQHIVGGTGFYPVTIAAPAFAHTVTLDAASTTGAEIINESSFTVSDAVTLFNDAVLNNQGGASFGRLDLFNQSSVLNFGIITLQQGGDFQDQSTVVNNASATIELAGGTLNVSVDINNSGLVKVDGGAVLNLEGAGATGAFEVSGMLNLEGTSFLQNGSLSDAGHVNVGGAVTFNDESVINSGLGAISVTGALTLKNGTSISGGALRNSGTVFVEAPTGATLDGVSVDNSGGAIQVEANSQLVLEQATIDGGTVSNDGTLALDGGAVIENGTFANLSQINVSGTSNSLDRESITANLALELLAGAALTIDQGSAVANVSGTVTVDDRASLTLNDATITSGTVSNAAGGALNLTGLAALTGGRLTNGGQINIAGTGNVLESESVSNNGAIDIVGALMLLGAARITNGTGVGGSNIVTVEEGASLTLEGTSSVIGGELINSGNVNVALAAGATLNGVNVNNVNSGTVSVAGGAALDLVNAAIIGGTLSGPGTMATTAGNTDSMLNGVTIAAGTTVTAAVSELDLSGVITNHGAIDAALGASIDLEGVTLNGGTLGGPGTIATVNGSNTLSGVTIASGTTVNVTDGEALDLQGTIAVAGLLALHSSGDATELKISGNVSLDGGGRVTLTDNIDNFIVSDGAAATLSNFDTITGAGTIGDANLALVNYGTIDASGSHTLTIDTGINATTSAGLVGSLLVTNSAGGVLEASAGHNLQIDDNVLNFGLIEAGNPASSSGAAVTITGSITGTGSIEIFDHAQLEIGGSVSSGQTVTFGTPGGTVAVAATLILDDSHDFSGTIVGLTENDDESLENHVDLKDLEYVAGHMSAYFRDGAVTVSNGTDSVTLKISGNSSGDFELAADATGGTLIDDPPASGTVTIGSGATLDISGASTATVSFTNNSGNTGELVIDHAADFTGTISGFTGDGTLSNSDLIDLKDINFGSLNKESYVETSAGTGGTLTLSDGTHTASINFAGNYTFENFKFASDGNGGTLVIDPPVPTAHSDIGTEWHDSHGTSQIWLGMANLVAEAHAGAAEISPLALLHAQLAAQHNGFHFF